MKNRGQTLVLFVILIPVFIVLIAIFADMGINSYYDNKFKSISEEIVKTLLNNDDKTIESLKDQAEMLYDANEMDTTNLIISVDNGNIINLYNTYEHYSFMNSLFGRGNGMREISVEIVGYIKDNEKIIEFKDGSNENN